MFASILAFLSQSWFGQIVSAVLNWWSAKQQADAAAQSAEQGAETAHQADGAQSVADKTSDDAQNQELDQLANQLDNPTPVVVTTPGGKQ